MNEQLTIHHIQAMNVYLYRGNTSERIRAQGFVPAFYNKKTFIVALSRFTSGQLAPVHLLDGLPDEWVAVRNQSGKILALKSSVVAGYVQEGIFYTTEQVTDAIDRA